MDSSEKMSKDSNNCVEEITLKVDHATQDLADALTRLPEEVREILWENLHGNQYHCFSNGIHMYIHVKPTV